MYNANTCSFELSIKLKNPEKKKYHSFLKNIKQFSVFNIDNNKKSFFSSKSAWFLKDHVTLKYTYCYFVFKH